MASFEIHGGKPLKGELIPQGAKNEALQVLCAPLLTDQKVTISNIPDIVDVNKLIEEIDNAEKAGLDEITKTKEKVNALFKRAVNKITALRKFGALGNLAKKEQIYPITFNQASDFDVACSKFAKPIDNYDINKKQIAGNGKKIRRVKGVKSRKKRVKKSRKKRRKSKKRKSRRKRRKNEYRFKYYIFSSYNNFRYWFKIIRPS